MHKNNIYWDLSVNGAVNRWAMSPSREKYFPGSARPMPDQVDYRFVNGWVETGDLPCREALREWVAHRNITLPSDLVFPDIYFGGEDNRVDFSTFRFRPTLITRWLTCSIYSKKAQRAEFSLETCGGLHLWQNGQKIVQLDHYQRNSPITQTITLDLPAGNSELVVFLEDLHERDASYYFVMTLLKGDDIQTGLELDINEQEVKEIERTLDGLRTHQIFYYNEDILIESDYLPDIPVTVSLATNSHPTETVTMNVLLDGMTRDDDIHFVVDKHFSHAKLFNTTGMNAGCISLQFLVHKDKLTFSRSLGTTVLSPAHSLPDELSERKQQALRIMLTTGKQEPARALAALALNSHPQLATQLIKNALIPVKERHDCADFWILPLLWMYQTYQGIQLDETIWQEIKHEILNFRYWLDEPGDDVMWFWSENHVLCFHVAQYLAGSLFPEEIFPNSGKSGAQHKQQAHERLLRWFDSVDEHGLAEWNSAAYYPIDFLGLFTLMENAQDDTLIGRARHLIDQIFIMVALHTTANVCAGSQGRIYEKELLAGPATELGSIAAVAFGGDWYPGHDRVTALLAVSRYEPPALCHALLHVTNSHNLYAKYTQGLDHNARVTLWKTPSLQLSTVSDYKTGHKGHQQHFLDVQTHAHPLSRFWINHPGDLKVWGGSRPSYWAGNSVHPKVAQYKNVGIMIFDQRAFPETIAFTHAFAPASLCDEFIAEEHWLFARAGSALIGMYSSAPLTAHAKGLYKGYEWRAYSRHHTWAVITGEADKHTDLARFKAECLAKKPHFSPERNDFSLQHEDGELILDYENGLSINQTTMPFSPMLSVPHISLNNQPLMPWYSLKPKD